MTNEEYEKMAVDAALPEARFHLEVANRHIRALEEQLAVLQERRREIINRYNLNKPCDHVWCAPIASMTKQCLVCGAEVPEEDYL